MLIKAYKITFSGAPQQFFVNAYSELDALDTFREYFPEYANKDLTIILMNI